MTATADKARYFLEQSVPELKELERKKIFSPEEISSITKRRTDFEYKINARGSTPKDYIQYAEFEMNVDALRKRRVKRLGVKFTTLAHSGPRRVFFVFDRGTRKFPGDVGLWTESMEYARRQQAHKKMAQILTSALRLHPAKSELWIYGASCAMEDRGDMNEARSYMQRGLRFAKNTRNLWVEYARLEMAYMAKIHARRQILGIGGAANKGDISGREQENDDVIVLPRLTADDIMPDLASTGDIDEAALQKLDSTPAMTGAIPVAIFDAAMTHFNNDVALGHLFFEAAADFGMVPVVHTILNHIFHRMQQISPRNWHTAACGVAMPVVDKTPDNPEYPSALRRSLQQITEGTAISTENGELVAWCRTWLETQLKGEIDPGIRTVLQSKLRSLI